MSPLRPLPTLEQLAVANQPVLLRADLNVPLAHDQVRSDARLRAALPTLRFLMAAGARVAVAAHLGRPKGARDPATSLAPVALRLAELLGVQLVMAHDCVGDGVRTLMQQLRPGQLICLENVRHHAGEEKNDPAFARALARPFRIYVGDAFGAAHRNHASVVGVVPHVGAVAAGRLMVQEEGMLGRLLKAPERPFVAVVGGSKVADKLAILQALVQRADVLLLGGAMAYTFLQAQDTAVGKSRVEPDCLRQAKALLAAAQARGCRLLLPEDHVAAATFGADAQAVQVQGAALPADLMGLDIGRATRARYAQEIAQARTVFWNGPLGVTEWPAFAQGSRTVAEAVAECPGFTVVGGGDSLAMLEAAGCADKISHLSTGGGAALEFLQRGTLPGLEALRRAR